MPASVALRTIVLAGLLLGAGSCAKPDPAVATGAALNDAAMVQMRNLRFGAAMALVQQRLHEDPRDARAAFLRGVLFNRLAKPDKAQRSFAAFRAAGGTAPTLDYEQGLALLDTGQPAEALAMLQRYRVAHPMSPYAALLSARAELALANLGTAHPDRVRVGRAETLLQTALPNAATHDAARLMLAVAARARRDGVAMRRQVEALVAEAPRSSEVTLLALAQRGRP